MPIFHKQTEVGDRLTAELSGQRTEGRPTLSLHASEIEDNDLRQCACEVKDEQLSLHAAMKLKNAISHYALVSSRANPEFWRSVIEVKDEQLPLSIKTEYGREMAYNATTWTERSNPSWHARFGLVGAAAMHDLHVIQGPNVTRDAREKIAFFPFHAFVVEDSRFRQNRVRARLYNCGACVCKSNVEIRIAGSFCRPQ